MKRTILSLSVLLALSAHPCIAQSIGPSTINAAGGSGTLGGNTYEWSIGELPMVSTFTGSSITVTQGVLQPLSGALGVADADAAQHVHVYPNPATAFVNIAYDVPAGGTMAYRLTDVAGRTVKEYAAPVRAGKGNLVLDMSGLANGAYLLHTEANTEVATFHIQKLQ